MPERRVLNAVTLPVWPDAVSIAVGPTENIEILVAVSTSVPYPTSPSSFWFAHDCRMIDERTQVRCAPGLDPAHRIEWKTDGLHISPSILCPDCGTHGFVTGGVWEPC